MLSETHTTRRRISGWYMNAELERIWTEAVIDESRYCPGICLERLKNCAEGFVRDTCYTSRDSNQASFECKTIFSYYSCSGSYFYSPYHPLSALLFWILFLTLNSSIMFISFPHSLIFFILHGVLLSLLPVLYPSWRDPKLCGLKLRRRGKQMHRTSWQWITNVTINAYASKCWNCSQFVCAVSDLLYGTLSTSATSTRINYELESIWKKSNVV
jgi:hypothetical protein